MSGLLTWALATAVGTSLFLALLWYAGRRRRLRYASWLCPVCGKTFGEQPERLWVARIDPMPGGSLPRGVSNRGPVLACTPCGREYWFGENGKLVDSNFGAAIAVEQAVAAVDPAAGKSE
jgi:hypothetical protein